MLCFQTESAIFLLLNVNPPHPQLNHKEWFTREEVMNKRLSVLRLIESLKAQAGGDVSPFGSLPPPEPSANGA